MSSNIKTFNRGRLRKLVEAGKVVTVATYHYDDMTGEQRSRETMPVALKPEGQSYGALPQGTVYLTPWHFATKSGCAYSYADGDPARVTLIVHSNSSYDLRILP